MATITKHATVSLIAVALTAVISGSVNIPPNSTVTVLTTPPSESFVLMQVCGQSNVLLSGASFGAIAQLTSDVLCYHFEPGYRLAPNETVQCTNILSASSFCSVSGVRTK